MKVGKNAVNAEKTLNFIQIISHVFVTITFSVAQLLIIFRGGATRVARMYSSFIFFAAAADLFLAVRVWYILEDKNKVEVIKDGHRAYVVKQVIKTREVINIDCDTEST